MTHFEPTFKKHFNRPEDQIQVGISYDIIRQFSSQLYSNPRKAIEELICNSYDAGATECHVKIPRTKVEPLVVLDNGQSMNLAGLRDLWMVAKSPKASGSPPRIANNRLQIGKFGVGKLAAYALGKRLTHVATKNGVTRVIAVAEEDLKGHSRSPKFSVYKAKESRARTIVEPLLQNLPKPWEQGWGNWTIAIVEEVFEENFDRALKIGILRRMIATALPVCKDFAVSIEGQRVPERVIDPSDIQFTVPVIKPEFRERLSDELKFFWAEKLDEKPEDVPSEYYEILLENMPDPHNQAKKLRAIKVPHLGLVEGQAIYAGRSLRTDKLEERGYADYGFQLYAHGKLINPEDELFGITPRSHAYWHKFQAKVEMPGLDDVLLVQRNAVSENSIKAQLAREVMRLLFNFTRNLAEAQEESEEFQPRVFGAKIRTVSPLLAPFALDGLTDGEPPRGGVEGVDIDYVSLGEDGPAAVYDRKSATIQVNQDHPIIASLDELGAKTQKQLRRVMGELVAGCKLGEGLLIANAVDAEVVIESTELLDASLRSAASYIRDPVAEHIQEIELASYEGDRRFEIAVANAFRSLGLAARRIGGSDNPDGIIDIPVTGDQNLQISFEAKGSKGVITHAELSQSTVARHQEESGCTSSIAIAREYQSDGLAGKSSGLLRETKDKLPLITVAAIARMLRLHQLRPFTYPKVAKILKTWKPPNEMEAFIEEQWRDLPKAGLMRKVLEVAHEKMLEHDHNYPDPGMLVGDKRLANIKKDDVKYILEAVAVATGMITIRNRKTYEFSVNAPVETILDAMSATANEDVPAEAPTDKKAEMKASSLPSKTPAQAKASENAATAFAEQ
jgi:hypothetical protein